MGFNCLEVWEPLRVDSLLLTIKSPQDVLVMVLIWPTSEGWKCEPSWKLPIGFEPETTGLEIQRPNH